MKLFGSAFHKRSIANANAEAEKLRGVLAEYEAGKRFQKERTYLHGYVQDPRFDATECVRTELVRKSRWFEKNDPLANRLAEVFTEFTVGPYGPPVSPATADEDWNQRASDWLEEWNPVADLTSRFGYGGVMTTAAWRRFFDGEFFILKTKGDGNRPRIQGISSHRVATPPEKYEQEGKTIVDGVQIDGRGRPIGYFIQEGFEEDKFTLRSANEVVHIFEPESPGQYRGLPMLTPVMNLLHDWNDLIMFERAAAKDAARITNIWETLSGEKDPATLRRERATGQTQNSSGEETTEARTRFLQKVLGSTSIAIKPGEKISQLVSGRPSVTSQWFMDYLASLICSGIGFSKLLVFPWSIQGTVARGEYDLSTNFFRARFAAFQSAAYQIYLFALGTARFQDIRVADAPADWATRVNIRPPASPNVDIGRNMAATISALESGLTTLEEQYGMRGQDWRQPIRQRAREEKFIDRIATESGLSADRIRKAIAESLKGNMSEEKKTQDLEDLQPA
ncbi:MAG: phage portal protein [Verrucomicrobiota bacterium]